MDGRREGEGPERASVLVVDDTPANLVALRTVLEPLRVRIVEALSGAKAIERASTGNFAVILLDVQMPEMDGFEVARRLRESATGREVPIIFLTAIHRDEQYARRGYSFGAADYITKPFDPDVLRARVKAFVDLYHQRDRLRLEQVGERTRERDEALEKLAALLQSERVARREAEIANGAKDAFLATVSHELRTPLNAILGWTLIARRHSSSPDVHRALSIVERSARTQMRIIEDLLDVSRMAEGKLSLEISATRVDLAIDGAVLAIRPVAEAKGVHLDVKVEEDVGVVLADAERLQQIVWNLLSNAVKFTSSGGHIEVHAGRSDTTVVVRVCDHGQGIPADFLPHLFEPFRQADASSTRRQGGIGIGLSIVKQLVDAHGGLIRVHSDGEGTGATFTVELPARPASAERPSSVRPGDSAAHAMDERLNGVSLLVVDDDEDARDLVACMMSEEGATVVCASSASEALEALREQVFHVVLCDIAMPDIDGYSLVRRIRDMPESLGGKTPAIALTAYARPVDGDRALDAGFQAHVTKPIDPERLTQVVLSLLPVGTDAPRSWPIERR